jgi:hypothetical protein
VLRYVDGQKYEPHYDYFHDAVNTKIENGGQRVVTLLMYLSTPKEGGETVFPDADRKVRVLEGRGWRGGEETGTEGGGVRRPVIQACGPRDGRRGVMSRGQRVVTLLMYLSTPKEGGETVFPDADRKVCEGGCRCVVRGMQQPILLCGGGACVCVWGGGGWCVKEGV